jgi:hypothetical protein
MRDIRKMNDLPRWPDRLSDWVLPPISDADPVRVFDTAETALAFLALLGKIRLTPVRASPRCVRATQ